MARIFVWLRYSSSRQLTWQRNYNTQPRILGEAQARLTNAIAQVCVCFLYNTVTLYQQAASQPEVHECQPDEPQKIHVQRDGI